MISSVLPRDPALPQLALALDEAAMGDHFSAQLPGFALWCRVDRIKYRPRRNLAVCYRLQGRDHDGRPFEQRVAARFSSAEDAARRHAKAQRGASHRTAAGPRLTHDAALGMLAHWWPNDAKLAASTALCDRSALHERWLPAVAGALRGPGARLAGHRVTLTQVVPEHRLTARVELQFDDGTTELVYAKADADRDATSTHALMQALHDSPAQRSGALRSARPLLWQPASGLHWQCALPGRPLLERAAWVDARTSARVGALLAELHATASPTTPTWTEAALCHQAQHVADTLAQVEAEWAGPAQALAQALVQQAGALARCPQLTLHGDLHPRNLLQDDRGALGLIDLDGARLGPAVLDLGAWIADQLYRALLAGQGPAQVLPACRAFSQAHAHAGAQRPSERLLAWAVAYQLLCQRAWRAVVNLKPGRYAQTGELLALAQRLLGAGHLDAAAERKPT